VTSNAGNARASGGGQPPTISFRDVSLLARVATLCGFDIESVLAEIGIRLADMQDGNAHADLGVISALMDLSIRRSTRAHYPFVLGEHYGFEHTPEIQTFLATSSSLREALWMLDFLPYFVHPGITSKHEFDGDRFTISFELRNDAVMVSSPGLIETIYVVLNRVLTQLLGPQVCPELAFRHLPMTTLASYEKLFGSRPSFGASHDVARYDASLLDRPLPSGSPALHAKMQLLLELRLKQWQDANGLETMLSTLLRHTPAITIEEASRRLSIGPRTLQRKLRQADTSFAAIQSQTRFHLAKTMLADRDLDMDAIAAKLGFADRTTFTKAFSKWSGLPPATYRRVRTK
jgi:AraC-like DNA-binding protein